MEHPRLIEIYLDAGTQTISDLIENYKSTGQKPSNSPFKPELPNKSFFDDEDED